MPFTSDLELQLFSRVSPSFIQSLSGAWWSSDLLLSVSFMLQVFVSLEDKGIREMRSLFNEACIVTLYKLAMMCLDWNEKKVVSFCLAWMKKFLRFSFLRRRSHFILSGCTLYIWSSLLCRIFCLMPDMICISLIHISCNGTAGGNKTFHQTLLRGRIWKTEVCRETSPQ